MSMVQKPRVPIPRVTWIIGLVVITLSLAVVRSKLSSSQVIPASTNELVAQPMTVNPSTTNGIVRKRVQSMGDLGRDGVILNSYEYPSGLISNVYVFTPGNTVTQVIAPPASDRWIGTKEYEVAAETDFERSLPQDPALAELKAIFGELPAAKDSHLFYSGLRQLVVVRAESLGVRRRRKAFEASGGDGVTFLPQHRYLTDDDWSRAYFRDRLELQSLQIRCKERLTRLYGPIPDELFQRLMSVKVLMVPNPLPDLFGKETVDENHSR